MSKLVITLLVLAGFPCLGWAKDKPNIILVYVDDMGYGDASCLNLQAKFKTPKIDRLAKEGMTFTDGHCSDTVCTPSRYGLITGRYSWRTTLKRGVMKAEAPCLIADGSRDACIVPARQRLRHGRWLASGIWGWIYPAHGANAIGPSRCATCCWTRVLVITGVFPPR